MGEGGDVSDSDSDETIIEGSVGECDLEEEELRGKRLSLIGKDMVPKTENNYATGIKKISGEMLSPEIQRICKQNIDLHILRQTEPINPLYQETNEKEKESQSLLQVGINCPVTATNIRQPVCLPAATVDGQHSHFICLDSEVTGLQEPFKKNGLNDEDSPEVSLLSGIHAMVEISNDSLTKGTGVSEAFQRVKMTSNKEDATESGLCLKTVASSVSTSRIMVEKFEDLMEPLHDSENSQMISPLLHMLGYQDNALCVNESVNESNALPKELLTPLNSLSESVVPSVCQPVGKESGHSMAEKQPAPEQTDDCTQIIDTNFKSQFHLQHLKEREPLRVTKSPFLSEEQLDCDQHMHKLVISDHQSAPSYKRRAGKENYILEETNSCKQTIQGTSYALRKSARKKRELPCSGLDAASKCQGFLEQKIQKDQAQTRSSDRAQEPNTKDQADQCSQLGIDLHHSLVSDVNTKAEQIRKSQRIARKNGKQTTSKNRSSDSSFSCISLSSINRRDIFGQTLLHKAVIEDDLNRVRAMIKAGANVNTQDYAGWTPLHEASVAGFFVITKELLKAGADVNCRGSEQITPLHDAVNEGHYKVAELLLWYGANPLLKTEKGKSAIEEATDNRMRTLLESYVDKSSRRSASGKRLVEDPVIDQSKIDKSQSQPKVKTNLSDRIQLSFTDNTKVPKQHIVKQKQNKGKRNPQSNSVTKTQTKCRLLKKTTFKSPCLVSKAKQSVTETPQSSLGTSGRKNDQRNVAQNDSFHTTRLHFSKRLLQPSLRHHKPDRICEAAEQASMLTKTQQESDSSNSSSYCSSEREKAHQSTQLSGTTKGQLTNSCIVTSSISIEEESILPSVTHLIHESNVDSTNVLYKDIGLPLLEEAQHVMKQHSNVPSYLQVDSLGDNLQAAEKVTLICTVTEEGANEQNREQYRYSENPICQVNLDCRMDVILEQELGLKDCLSMTETIPLEENLLESKNTTTQSLQGTSHFSDSDCTVLSEHYNFIADQNADKNTSKAVGICNEQTVQISMEMSSTCAFSQGINRTDVSESLDTYSSTQLRIFTPHMHEDLMMGPRPKGNAGKCCLERTENGTRLENNTILDLQVFDKVPFQDTHQTEKQQIPDALDSSHFSKKEKTTSSSKQLSSVASRINKRNTKGETRLHLAAKKGDLSLVKSLIASGACVNQKDNAGWTPIHEASSRGYTEVIAELLKAGADVNCKSLDGVVPIHDAVSGNHFEAVQFLLHHGANPNETDGCRKNALDEATCDKMIELLKSYGATETQKTSRMSDVAEGRDLRPPKSRRTRNCYDCCEKDKLVSYPNAAKHKCGAHESLSKILQDIEEKQDRLLLFELKSQRDADWYMQDLSQIQNILNEVLAKQKSERDDLAKKYRASAESFKQGALREQLVKLVSRQKSLLLMAQKQKELGQKLLNYNNAKKDPSGSAKQIISSCARNKGTSGKTAPYPDVIMDLETCSVVKNSSSDQETSQYPNRSLSVSGDDGDAIRQKEVGLHNLVPKNRLRAHTIADVLNSKTSDSIDQATLLSEPVVFIQTAQSEEIDYISVAPQGNKHLHDTPRTSILNISASGNFGVPINQPTTEDQHICSNESLQQHSNINEEPTSEPTHSYLATHQKDIFLNNRIVLDDNSEPTGMFSHVLSPSRFSQNPSQSSDNKNSGKQLKFKANRRKKNQLLDLLELGRIKPGDDVLEFTLQDSKHKASLLGNGKVKTPNNLIYQNPVQWIKALLGNGISVSWKYVWNKVTYSGILLSTIIAEVEESFKKPELPLQPKSIFGRNSTEQDHSCVAECFCSSHKATSLQDVYNIQQKIIPFCQEEVGILSSPETEAEEPPSVVGEITKYSIFQGSVTSERTKSSYQPTSPKTLKRFLQFSEIVLIKDEEFMPCHIMDQYWNFYVHCENFGF